MFEPPLPDRRRFLGRAAQLALAGSAGLLSAQRGWASAPPARSLALDHTHTRERLTLVYALGERYLPPALGTLNHFLRDHYSGEVGVIDPQLFDLLHQVQSVLGATQPFQVISGYRGPVTNANLRSTRAGGVATRSLHMDGKAIDIRLPGVPLTAVRDAALALGAGGVGFYPREQFVHVDTGRVRSW